MRLLTSLALLLAAATAHAACPATVAPNKACIHWTASPGWTDGSKYAAGTVVTYTVYLVSATDTSVQLGTTTNLDFTTAVLKKGSRCFAVTATVNDAVLGTQVSALSNQTCKVIRLPGPTDGKIEGPTDGAIEPR